MGFNNLNSEDVNAFLKLKYHKFENFDEILFYIFSDKNNQQALMVETIIHRYARAIGFDAYKIIISESVKDVDEVLN